MKKLLAFLLAFSLLFCLTACGDGENNDSKDDELSSELTDNNSNVFNSSNISTINPNITIKDDSGNILLTSADIENINQCYSEGMGYYIQLDFNENGAVKLASVTKKYTGENLSIFAEETLLVSAVVYQEITNGSITINGSFDEKEIDDMHKILTSTNW